MDGIAKTNSLPPPAAPGPAVAYPDGHPALVVWTRPGTGLLHRLHAHMADRRAHPAHTVVLLPLASQPAQARALWAQTFADGFMPRFDTRAGWVASLNSMGGKGVPDVQTTDIHFDTALDRLTARSLLDSAGLSAHANVLVERLVQAAWQLGELVAAMAPAARSQWAQAARQTLGMEIAGQALQWEVAVARIALEWALASSWPGEVLFDPEWVQSLDALVLVQGLLPDPLANGLQNVWKDKLGVLPFAWPDDAQAQAGMRHSQGMGSQGSTIALHACDDAEDEAQRAAACVLRHIEAGRTPLALVCPDRALTRRVSALLGGAGVTLRDENGWKLSTSASAAKLMSLLKAAVPDASSDAVLCWLKQAPGFAPNLSLLEATLRRAQLRQWRDAANHPAIQGPAALAALYAGASALLRNLSGRLPLVQWLERLRLALQSCGMWQPLLEDAAGAQVLSVLRLEDAAFVAFSAFADSAPWSGRRLDAMEFTTWVDQSLESSHFLPAHQGPGQVVIVPLHQMPGRPFAALVVAGCDEVRLPPSPEPVGTWTATQRRALGLPSREAQDAALRAAWQFALQMPVCDVLWRTGDESGEPLLPSPLVQLLMLDQTGVPAVVDPRAQRHIPGLAVIPPLPGGSGLPLTTLTQSAYEDLRQCPYRFFAMRLLGLSQVNELEADLGKRDFGIWLHEVLKRFHTTLAQSGAVDTRLWPDMLDAAQVDASMALDLAEAEFLPFVAAWPGLRDGYLAWLAGHVAEGMQFMAAESSHRQAIGNVVLQGRIDRIDRAADGQAMVLDYKTESVGTTAARVKEPLEDTQMAFYAALLPDDTLRAAYVNVGEKETRRTEQTQVVHARDALTEGIAHDMQRIAEGAALPALGEGAACDFCKVRGLCRKDFWATP